ncbi:substrate-binding domain-containing protein, partial [uncultured Desulfovibrio sp.]|uniref:substrate-binding domain-containing protein n=1 Tax=uncultured Desulfovibrio sp. TaxID=167968 RepID=UPI00260CC0DA
MMTRTYPRYALMTAALGFWLLCVSIGGVWGGLEVGVSCLFKLFAVSIWSPLAYLLAFGLLILYTSISFVASLGRRLAAEAPRGCSVSALLLPPLLPLLMLAFIPPATEELSSLLQHPWSEPHKLLLLFAVALLYAVFLLAFCFHSHARKKAEGRDGEERPTDDDGARTAWYQTATVTVSVFILPLCTLLNLFILDEAFFVLKGGSLLVQNNGIPLELASELRCLPGEYSLLAAVVCFSLTVPMAYGAWLAAHARTKPTFNARYLPLLLPLPLFLVFVFVCVRIRFGPVHLYGLLTASFLLTYGLFLLAFRLGIRACPPVRSRRVVVISQLLVFVLCCAAVAVDLHTMLRDTVSGKDDALDKTVLLQFWGRFSPERAGNTLVLPAAPPSLRLGEDLPTLSGVKSSRPLYAAAFQAVACLDEDGCLLSEEILSRRVEQARLSSWIDRPDSVDIFFGPPPSQRQLDALRARGLTPDVRPVAREALVFFVQKDNPVRNLSSEQLRRIYTGEITNWKEVGGRDERILPFQHEGWDENQHALEELVLRGEEAAPPLLERPSMGPACDVARYRKRAGALGFGLRWYLDKWFPDGDFRPLAVDGVTPTDASLRDGSYPLIVPLCLIACRPLDDDSRAFRDWLLGPEGRDLIRRAGYLPW